MHGYRYTQICFVQVVQWGMAARAMYPAFYVGRVSWVKACCIKVVKKIKET